MKRFNIRVYGICVNEQREVLLSDERVRDFAFTKFPGGGLDWGEGTRECLQREFMEEFGLEVETGRLFYLTDFFQQSAFNPDDQVVSVYYQVNLPGSFDSAEVRGDKGETLRWKAIREMKSDDLTFPIDKKVLELLLLTYS